MEGVSFQNRHCEDESLEGLCYPNQANDVRAFGRFDLAFAADGRLAGSYRSRDEHTANRVDDQTAPTPGALPSLKNRFRLGAIVNRCDDTFFRFGVVSDQQNCKQVQGPQILDESFAEVSARSISSVGLGVLFDSKWVHGHLRPFWSPQRLRILSDYPASKARLLLVRRPILRNRPYEFRHHNSIRNQLCAATAQQSQ
jgi:hypothetical protein